MERNFPLKNLQRDITFTAANYSQMYKRLTVNDAASRFFTTYYSAVSIVLGLLPRFFPERIDSQQTLEFLLLSSSIVVLVVSLMVSFAKYSERSYQVMVGLNQMKRLKKELAKYSDAELEENHFEKYQEFVASYHQIVDHIELRTDGDYYRACKVLASKEDCKDSWQTLPCFIKVATHLWPVMKFLFYFVLFTLPIFLMVMPGVIFK